MVAQVQIFLPLNPSSSSKEGSSTAGTVESAKGIFLLYNVMVSKTCILHSIRTVEEEGDEVVSYFQGGYCSKNMGSVYWWEVVCDFF